MNARTDVVVTGFGVFSAFGLGEQALFDGVFDGIPAFAEISRFDTSRFRCSTAATYDAGGPDVPGQLEVLERCARAALDMSGVDPSTVLGALVGTQGDYRTVRRFWQARAVGGGAETVPVAESHPGQLSHALAERLDLGPLRLTFTNACVASADTIVHAARLISREHADAVLCAGAYLVEEELFAKFDSARAFAKDGLVRPFSKDRTGLLLGDGVGALILESGSTARARGAEVLARVEGWGNSSDAFHVSRPHPEGRGTAKAVEGALRVAGLTPDRIGYVNVHGTGTPSNDVAETAALHAVFGDRAPYVPVSSTKGATGHALEGAGVLEAIITLLALCHRLAPPTASYTMADPACNLDYVTDKARELDMTHVISVNSAFGGVNTALVLERP